ncbi:uncharacterized protein LOC143861420 [Tasmannia lanceolata]|uniref:uncharacterized protein LOC143861420 n=1 Tax=Tasmannia lanceolata TaxID=3420 RepID=UPI0040646D8F
MHASVNWASTLWFSGHVPRHALMAWKALHLKLLTRDHIIFRNSSIDERCPLCHSEKESIDHLFFRCGYSAWIWKSILRLCGFHRSLKRTLRAEEEWIRTQWRGKGQSAVIIRVAFAASIYRLWKERNRRIFDKKFNHKSVVLQQILDDVKLKVRSLNVFYDSDDRKIRMAREYKLNTDASLSDEGGGLGGTLRDSNGEVLHCFSVNTQKDEIFSLEIKAICIGVEVAKRLGITHLWIEADSNFAVNSFAKLSDPPWKNLSEISKCWKFLNTIDWKITHIWREANSVADLLSKRDYPCKSLNIPLQCIPNYLRDSISRDISGEMYLRL